MKRVIVGIALVLSLASPAHSEPILHQHPYDYLSHAAIGGGLGYWVTSESWRPVLGVLAATAAGALKECADKNFDTGDLAFWTVGGVLGAALGKRLVITPAGIFWQCRW
ncbi:MAG: hypothetical protein AB1697_04890 [Pseudomonadota bacterium]